MTDTTKFTFPKTHRFLAEDGEVHIGAVMFGDSWCSNEYNEETGETMDVPDIVHIEDDRAEVTCEVCIQMIDESIEEMAGSGDQV